MKTRVIPFEQMTEQQQVDHLVLAHGWDFVKGRPGSRDVREGLHREDHRAGPRKHTHDKEART